MKATLHLLVLVIGLSGFYYSDKLEAAEPAPTIFNKLSLDGFLVPSAPKLNAKSYILVDFDSQLILAEHNANERFEPASLTKMMTVYLIDKALANGTVSLDDEVTISENAWRTEGSRMFVEVDTQVKVSDLLRGIIIQSGNDASVAMAEYLAGSEAGFAELMNQQAAILGMHDSHFMNATGLPNPDHYMSANDLAILATAIIRDYPETYSLYAEQSFTYNDIYQPNRNQLLKLNLGVDGLKTGHTDSAGYELVASAKQGDMRIISVIMGATSETARTEQSISLINYAFRSFTTHKLYSEGQPLNEYPVWMGTQRTFNLGLEDDLYITIPRGEYDNIETRLQVQPIIKAPISVDEPFGALSITLDNQNVMTRPLIALNDVPSGGFWRKISDYLKLLFHRIFSKTAQPEVIVL